VFEFVVLRHVAAESVRKQLNEGSPLQLPDQALGVLLQLFLFYLFVGVDVVNLVFQVLDGLQSLDPLELFVVSQVLQQLLGRELAEALFENVAFVFEKLVDSVLILHRVENVGGQSHNHIQRLVQEVGLDSQL
jgi:hypothetical protein